MLRSFLKRLLDLPGKELRHNTVTLSCSPVAEMDLATWILEGGEVEV